MNQRISPLAGKSTPESLLVDVAKLLAAYAEFQPDPRVAAQRVSFGTSGHRGTSFERSFNQWHVLAITQAICDYRNIALISGPLFIGIDTHALSRLALETALEVLAANEVHTMIAPAGEFTPTPAISHAILAYNRERTAKLADGIVITPSHNPPDVGGIKYNLTNGGPANTKVTAWVQARANALLESGLIGVKRTPTEQMRCTGLLHEHDYLSAYVDDLGSLIDFDVIRGVGLCMGVDPLGGAGVHYWARIAERYNINLSVVSEQVDPQFGFMTADWDGKIRMDPSSQYAMRRLVDLRDKFDVAFACDTDHDRHGIVTRSVGLMPANHYLSVAIDYLFQHRFEWTQDAAVGKTIVSSTMIDRVAALLGRTLIEVPAGFKWFADKLFDGSLGLAGEESAGASFLRRDGRVWTTDKDGIALALLSAEITASTGRDPGVLYRELCMEFGEVFSDRIDAVASNAQKKALAALTSAEVTRTDLAGDAILAVLDKAPGDGEPIGGIKVITEAGWFAARPSGTEDIYKIYAESFRDEDHLQAILDDAQLIVDQALAEMETT